MYNVDSVNQLGYIVRDLDAALDFWVNVLGVGPWFVSDMEPQDYKFRGQPGISRMRVALANCGDLQIELIQDVSDGPTYFKELLAKGRDGIQHISFWRSPEEFKDICGKLLDYGFTEAQSGASALKGGSWAYFEHENLPGVVIEPASTNPAKTEFMKKIAKMSKDWDGSDPVRRAADLF